MNDLKETTYYFFKSHCNAIVQFLVGCKALFCLLGMAFVLLSSCSREQAVPVNVDFTISMINGDYSVPVKVAITNQTFGAESYSWSFEGADRTGSTDRNPGTLVYNHPGTYKIRLEATNSDGSKDAKELEFTFDASVAIDFDYHFDTNHFAPATIEIHNTSKGATTFFWSFEGGDPVTSNEQQPGKIIFAEPGDHEIKLTVGNGREIHELVKTITVGPQLLVDFDWQVAFEDDDFQVPVTIHLTNKSTGNLESNWHFSEGQPSVSHEESPTAIFNEPGTHTMALTVSNGKETKTLTKSITVLANTNLRVFEDVRFGINTAHHADVVGAYFSAATRETYSESQIQDIDGGLIDLAFFGLDGDFSYNKFISPYKVGEMTFEPIPQAKHTVFINSLEQCACSASLSNTQFDAMTDDSVLQPLNIEETQEGLQHFTSAIVPRIVLFQTADGRKGAIRIKEYVANGQHSYILTDIKIQKESR